ncbi:hypothetical protein BT96DRAFT_937991 [Gymnopus androsaceus JB14]|uniref:DUF1996 domain-containing protein n=1 Tax=Gymnopus androsaceus JB14 TaxID=1447944 RepID=A0A6A4HU86_9AGAR|nr:hypothetical protein BT96DRAFT_937991 [Gymnopus androsaceus JB14]
MLLQSYNTSSYAQQAITFFCLDFNGVSTKYSSVSCPSGIRAKINIDPVDHKSHVAFPSGGPDSGTCDDPTYPVTLPQDTDALNSAQPYVYSFGNPYGFGYYADFFNGWDSGVLQNVLNECACNATIYTATSISAILVTGICTSPPTPAQLQLAV